MGQHRWYKFFSERRWAEAFLEGEVLFRSLAYFRDYEDNTSTQVRGDHYEGTRTCMPEGGVIMRGRKTGEVGKFTEPWAFNALVNAEGIFVFCVSSSYNNLLIREFNAVACIELLNKSAFFARLNSALLPLNAKLVSGAVEYYRQSEQLQALLGASPGKIVRSKLERFSYQDEYRFAFSTTNALDVGGARFCLREFKPTPNPSEHHKKALSLGSLRDICRLHECGENQTHVEIFGGAAAQRETRAGA
jgi:hypothetical protein